MLAKYSFLRENNKGFVMILTYLLILVLFLLGVAFFARTTSEKRLVSNDKDNTLAFNAAEAGLIRAIVDLRNTARHNLSDVDLPFDPFNNNTTIADINNASTQYICVGTTMSNCTSSNAIANYRIMVDPDDTNDQHPTSSKFAITAQGAVGALERTVSTVLQTDNFARFAYFSDTEHFGRTSVWFFGNDTRKDEIRGPSYTNDHYHIYGNPIFYDVTKSVDDYVTYYHGGPPDDSPLVQGVVGGFILGADPIPMPHQAIELHTAAVEGGTVFNGDTTVTLKSDGTMDVVNAQYSTTHADCNPCNVTAPSNHAVYVSGGDLTLSGTLTGSLTVGTNRNIIITSDIKYSKVPTDSSLCIDGTVAADGRLCSSDDSELSMLGIIAEKQVIVSSSAPHNIEIDASIMAMDESFIVENWNKDSDPSTPGFQPKGTLEVFGGIIQDTRGPVGTFDSTTNTFRTGYSKNYIYDSRFETNPPLYFPQTGDYLNLVWQEDLGLGDSNTQ
jgi:hypothetical protein